MRIATLIALFTCTLAGCGDGSPPFLIEGSDSDSDSDADADSDSDTDADADADSDADTDADADADTDTDADSDADCTEAQSIFIDWGLATVTSPMEVRVSEQIPGMSYVITTAAYAGSAQIAFDVPCTDTWYVWGVGYVQTTNWGDGPNDFTVSVDGGEPLEWLLDGENEWLWNQFSPEGEAPFEFELAAGPGRTLTVYGGDAMTMGGSGYTIAPALGYLWLSNDPGFEPGYPEE